MISDLDVMICIQKGKNAKWLWEQYKRRECVHVCVFRVCVCVCFLFDFLSLNTL